MDCCDFGISEIYGFGGTELLVVFFNCIEKILYLN